LVPKHVEVTALELEARSPIFTVRDVGHDAALHQLTAAPRVESRSGGVAIERQDAAVAEGQLGERASIGADLRHRPALSSPLALRSWQALPLGAHTSSLPPLSYLISRPCRARGTGKLGIVGTRADFWARPSKIAARGDGSERDGTVQRLATAGQTGWQLAVGGWRLGWVKLGRGADGGVGASGEGATVVAAAFRRMRRELEVAAGFAHQELARVRRRSGIAAGVAVGDVR
jgi:hypothetical protein